MMNKLQLPYSFSVTCPHCGLNQPVTASRAETAQIIECDTDDGPGCGKLFVVRCHSEIIIDGVYTLAGPKEQVTQ